MSDGCQAAPCWENQRWSCGLWCLSPHTHCQDTQGLSLNKVIAQTPAVLFSFPLFSLLADLFVDCLLWLFKKRYSKCWFVEAVRESEFFSLFSLTFDISHPLLSIEAGGCSLWVWICGRLPLRKQIFLFISIFILSYLFFLNDRPV